MPDIFVPEDTTAFTPYFGSLIRRGILTEFVNQYCDKMRPTVTESCPDFASFYAWYTPEVENGVLEELIAYAAEKGLERNDEEITGSYPALKPRVKALIARTFFSLNEYYMVINRENDPEFKIAVDVILNWDPQLPSIGR